MTATKTKKIMEYSWATVKRAQRAMSCCPFRLGLFQAMAKMSVPLPAIADNSGLAAGYTRKPTSEAKAEAQLNWLIEVGLLRREVDGQGITDSFRVTPLGKQIINQWSAQGGEIPAPSLLDRLNNFFSRLIK